MSVTIRSQQRYRWVAWLLLGLSLAVVFGPSLRHPFHYDDLHSVVENPHIRNLGGVGAVFDAESFSGDPQRAMFRPLVVLTHALNYRVGGADPGGYHLTNLLLHAAMVLVVGWFALTSRLASSAWPAAALFALHPLNVEVATYVSARSESMAALGIFLALAFYIRSQRRHPGGPGSRQWIGAGVLAMVGGLLAKATAITSVGLIGLWQAQSKRRNWLTVLPFVMVAAVYLLQTRTAVGNAVGTPVRALSVQAVTQLKALIYYLYLMVMPVRLSVEHAFSESNSLDATVTVAGLCTITIALAIWRLGSRTTQFACLGAVGLLMPSTLVPLNVLVNEHRLYPVLALLIPASVGFLRSPGLQVNGHKSGSDRRGVLLVAVLVLSGIMSSQRVSVWGSGRSLWQDAVSKAPGMYRAHLHLGGVLEEEGQVEAAHQAYRRAVDLAPDHEQTQYNLANTTRGLGDTLAAMRLYERSLEISPAFVEAAINLAALHEEAGDPALAVSVLSGVIERQDRNAELYRRRGLSHRHRGDEGAAEQDFRSALALAPASAEAHFNLANLLFDTQRVDEATRQYREALRDEPAHQGAAYNLADLALRQGDPVLAQSVAEAALLVGPVQGKLYYLLAQAHDQQGRPRRAIANYRHFLQAWPVPAAARDVVEQRIRQLTPQ